MACAKEFEEIDIRNKNRRDKNIFFIAIKDWILEMLKTLMSEFGQFWILKSLLQEICLIAHFN